MATPITVTNEAPAPGLRANELAAQGLIVETFRRVDADSNLTLTGGTAYGVLLPVYPGQVLTNAVVQVQAAGSGTTHAACGLYSLDGTTLYASTADSAGDRTLMNTTGTKALAFSSAWTVPAGVTAVYAVFVATASVTVVTLTTGPAMQTGAAVVGSGYFPVVTGGTGLTALPAVTVTFTVSATVKPPWIGIS